MKTSCCQLPRRALFKYTSSAASLACSIHFLVMWWFLFFILVHVTLVFITGARVNLNMMFAGVIGIGGRLATPPLPHHRAYGSVPRRFESLANTRRTGTGDRAI